MRQQFCAIVAFLCLGTSGAFGQGLAQSTMTDQEAAIYYARAHEAILWAGPAVAVSLWEKKWKPGDPELVE